VTLEKAVSLRKSGKLKESNEILVNLAAQHPNDAMVQYQCAWSYDVLEREEEAIYYYERAIELGLPLEDLKEAYLGLGSTYRTIGEFKKSKELLEKAIGQFDDNALKVFYAMTLYNLNQSEEALEILLKLIAETSNDESIQQYAKAIGFYADKLDKVFK